MRIFMVTACDLALYEVSKQTCREVPFCRQHLRTNPVWLSDYNSDGGGYMTADCDFGLYEVSALSHNIEILVMLAVADTGSS
ncbi:hypothetical protein PR003_g13492 [Phytophthora rubi]|uniref:Uncharacterized protein n=1 Tax=Phytophthora rubi TaxID=129364 RepID=A0A6A4F224_9STRA|nr:hypothetical protein PR003_g13492 [Phytophthora rubi]